MKKIIKLSCFLFCLTAMISSCSPQSIGCYSFENSKKKNIPKQSKKKIKTRSAADRVITLSQAFESFHNIS